MSCEEKQNPTKAEKNASLSRIVGWTQEMLDEGIWWLEASFLRVPLWIG
jgi:hypothetical protein